MWQGVNKISIFSKLYLWGFHQNLYKQWTPAICLTYSRTFTHHNGTVSRFEIPSYSLRYLDTFQQQRANK